jgi:LysM repeat protein
MSRLPIPALLLAASASLMAGPPAPESAGCGGAYTVSRGDTLYSIARRCRSSLVEIARASGIADPTRIEIGQRLVIAGSVAAAEPGKEEPALAATGPSYRMVTGDTLYSLARWARVGVGALIAANPGIDPHKIEIGDIVRLPAGAVPPDAARRRERGTGPGPALMRAAAPASPQPAPPLRIHARERHPPPPRPSHDKPEAEDERAPEGM